MSDSFADAVDVSGAALSAATRALFRDGPRSTSSGGSVLLGRLEEAVRRHVVELRGVGITGALAGEATRVAVRHAAESSAGATREAVAVVLEEVERMLAEGGLVERPGPRLVTPSRR